jgi:hypothetical protein
MIGQVEAVPNILCSADLGRLVTSIEVDADYFANLMAREGLDEYAISSANLAMSSTADALNKAELSLADRAVFGNYDPTTKTAVVNIGTIALAQDAYVKSRIDSPLEDNELNYLNSLAASRIAVHEIGHHIERASISTDDWLEKEFQYFADIIPEQLVGRVLRRILRVGDDPIRHQLADTMRRNEVLNATLTPQFEHYKGSPSEVKVREITDRAEVDWREGYLPIRTVFCRQVGTSY